MIYDISQEVFSGKVYLARLDQSKIDKRMTQRSLGVIDFNEFDVFQNNSNIGKYICKDQKDQTAKYFHFKKFEFVKS